MVGGANMEDEKILNEQDLTVEELDELLAKEFAKNDDEDEETEQVTADEEEETKDDDDDSEDSNEQSDEHEEPDTVDESEVGDADVTPKKGKTSEEKKDYAFAKLRKEASEAKRLADEQAKKLEESDSVLRTLMEQSGFSDLGEFKKALQKQVDEKKRKESGYTEQEYERAKAIEQREANLKKREEEIKQLEFNSRAKAFDSTVREVIKEYGMSEPEREKVYAELERLGYTADVLLAMPSPRHLIKGVVIDMKGSDAPVKRKTVDTQRIVTTQDKTSLATQQDELLKKELRDYERRKNGQ